VAGFKRVLQLLAARGEGAGMGKGSTLQPSLRQVPFPGSIAPHTKHSAAKKL